MTTKLIIDRGIWLRGEGSHNSYLIRSTDGKQCCLGFYARSCKVPLKNLLGTGSPQQTDSLDWEGGSWVFSPGGSFNSLEVSALMKINDDEEMLADEREEKIAEIFARHDVEVEFIY